MDNNNLQQLHFEMVILLNEWDPFKIGHGRYDTEVADVIQAVHDIDDTEKLAERIVAIYEFSFEEELPLKECHDVAMQLLQIKNSGLCDL